MDIKNLFKKFEQTLKKHKYIYSIGVFLVCVLVGKILDKDITITIFLFFCCVLFIFFLVINSKIRILFLISAILCFCYAGWRFCSSIFFPEPVVIITPNKIHFITSDWGKTQIVEIKNTETTKTLYAIWIKVEGQDSTMDLEDIDIMPETGDEFFSENLGKTINVNYDFMIICGWDAQNKPCKYLQLYKLKSLESSFFKIKKKESKNTEAKPLILSLTMKGFSENPSAIFTKNNEAGPEFCPPEAITMKSIAFSMKALSKNDYEIESTPHLKISNIGIDTLKTEKKLTFHFTIENNSDKLVAFNVSTILLIETYSIPTYSNFLDKNMLTTVYLGDIKPSMGIIKRITSKEIILQKTYEDIKRKAFYLYICGKIHYQSPDKNEHLIRFYYMYDYDRKIFIEHPTYKKRNS